MYKSLKSGIDLCVKIAHYKSIKLYAKLQHIKIYNLSNFSCIHTLALGGIYTMQPDNNEISMAY